MGEAVHVARSEDETATQLEGIPSEFVLGMAGGFCAAAGLGIVASQEMKQVRALELHGGIGFALLVNEEREGDAGFFAESTSVEAVAEPDGGQVGAAIPESLFVRAQLRDMLAAEDSTIMAQENDHGRLADP